MSDAAGILSLNESPPLFHMTVDVLLRCLAQIRGPFLTVLSNALSEERALQEALGSVTLLQQLDARW